MIFCWYEQLHQRIRECSSNLENTAENYYVTQGDVFLKDRIPFHQLLYIQIATTGGSLDQTLASDWLINHKQKGRLPFNYNKLILMYIGYMSSVSILHIHFSSKMAAQVLVSVALLQIYPQGNSAYDTNYRKLLQIVTPFCTLLSYVFIIKYLENIYNRRFLIFKIYSYLQQEVSVFLQDITFWWYD